MLKSIKLPLLGRKYHRVLIRVRSINICTLTDYYYLC